MNFEDGTYEANLTLEGGSGRATVEPESTMTVVDGEATVEVIWSSPNYDYMIVEGEKYLPVNTEGNSTFEIPVLSVNEPYLVIGDTTAMSKPHEIEYQLTVSVEEEASTSAGGSALIAAFAGVFILLFALRKMRSTLNKIG